jgi:hypothetical protein
LLFLVFVCVVGYFAWKYREQIRHAIEQLIEDLKRLWSSLFGARQGKDGEPGDAANLLTEPPPPSFSSFTDPFAAGTAERFSTEQLVRYTFEALEAWARDHACPRQQEQTPFEFSHQIAFQHADLAQETQALADLYSRVAYGHERIPSGRRRSLARIWQQLRVPRPSPPPPPEIE